MRRWEHLRACRPALADAAPSQPHACCLPCLRHVRHHRSGVKEFSSLSLCFQPQAPYALVDCPAAWTPCTGERGRMQGRPAARVGWMRDRVRRRCRQRLPAHLPAFPPARPAPQRV